MSQKKARLDPAAVNAALPARLRQIRQIGGLTQRDFARAIGQTHAMVSFYEAGRFSPRFEHVMTLLDLLGLPLSVLTDAELDVRAVRTALLRRQIEDLRATMAHIAMEHTPNHGKNGAPAADFAMDNTGNGAEKGPDQAESMDNSLLVLPRRNLQLVA